MTDPSMTATWLEAAKAGDEQAFTLLSEPHRKALLTHCYQLLGSLQDAEDMVQETLLRAWSRLTSFDGRAAYRTWLYSIATHACLDLLRQQQRQPHDTLDDTELEHRPVAEISPTFDPLPNQWLPDPETAYLVRESVNIAFMTVLQRLLPRQRAVLILRDVLNWKAKEVADLLVTTESAVNSALLRAREALQATGYQRPPAPQAHDTLLGRYLAAWEAHDIDGLVALLREDALFTMPPLAVWFQGVAAIRAFLAATPLAPTAHWRGRWVGANGQPALALYQQAPDGIYRLAGLHLLHLSGEAVARMDHFLLGAVPHMADPLWPAWVRFFDLPLAWVGGENKGA